MATEIDVNTETGEIIPSGRLTMSPQIDAIAAALSKAQEIMEGAAKDSANPFFKSRYADLASVWEACRRPLALNGLCMVQAPSADGPRVTIETLLAHSSGQWFRSALTVTAKDDSPQSVGSAVSYLRRYALQSIVGVAPADDDGEAAQGRGETKAEPKREKSAPKPELLTESEVNALKPYAKAAGFETSDAMAELVTTVSGAKSMRTMERRWLPELQAALEGIAAARGVAK